MNNFKKTLASLIFGFGYLFLSCDLAHGYHVAIVKSRTLNPYSEAIAGIRQGIVESKEDIKITEHDLKGDREAGYEIAQEILNQKINLVFAVGTDAAHGLNGRIGNIPLVVVMMHDPATEFEAKKKQTPTLYGIPLKVPITTQMDLIKELTPQFKTISTDCDGVSKAEQVEMKNAALERNINLVCISIDEKRGIASQLDVGKEKSDAFFFALPSEPYHKATIQEFLLFSARNKFPIITFTPSHVRSGALMSFSYEFKETGMEAARLAVQILGGTPISRKFRNVKNVIVTWNQTTGKSFNIDTPKSKNVTIRYA